MIWVDNRELLGAQTDASLHAAWQRAERPNAGAGLYSIRTSSAGCDPPETSATTGRAVLAAARGSRPPIRGRSDSSAQAGRDLE